MRGHIMRGSVLLRAAHVPRVSRVSAAASHDECQTNRTKHGV
jgi:hypothetical protein